MRLLLALFLLPIVAFGQVEPKEISYKLGQTFSEGNLIEGTRIFDNNGEPIKFIINWAYGKYKYSIQKYNPKTLTVKTLEVGKFSKEHIFEGVEMINGKLYLFYSKYNPKPTSDQLFIDEVNLTTGKLNGEEKIILTVDGNAKDTEHKLKSDRSDKFVKGLSSVYAIMMEKMSFDVQLSADASKLLVKYWKPDPSHRVPVITSSKVPRIGTHRKLESIIGFQALDLEFEPIWKTEVKMPYIDRKMSMFNYLMDTDGNVFFLAKIYKDNSQEDYDKSGSLNHHLELFKIDAASQQMSHNKIEINGGNHISQIKLKQTEGKIVCTGFYNDGEQKETTTGIFSGTVDQKNCSVLLKNFNFSQYLRPSKRMSHVKVMEVIANPDGSVLVFGEEMEMRPGVDFNEVFYYNDILITKFDSKNAFKWMKSIPKHQYGYNSYLDLGFSYLAHTNDSHYILMVDNIKNLNLKHGEELNKHVSGKRGHITICKISDHDGSVSKKSLLNVEDVPNHKTIYPIIYPVYKLSSTDNFIVCKRHKEDYVALKVLISELE